MASIQNLASGVLASYLSSSDHATSLSVNCGEGSSSTLTAVWPSVPFYITVMPAYPTVGVANSLDSEIMLVSALSASDNVVTMTVARGQRGTTNKAFSAGAIVTNGIYTADMDYAQAVGKSFFSATLTNSSTGSYTVSDSMLPNTPEDGMSIRVVFGTSWTSTSVVPKLRINSGSYYNIYSGNNLRSDAGTTTTKAMVKSGVIYELTYYNGAWYVLNLVAGSSIVSDNIDWTTLQNAPIKTWSGQGFYGCTFSATRCGNLVIAQISGRCNGQMANTSTSSEAFASGYRPRANAEAVLRTSSGAALVGIARFYTNGKVFWWIPTSVPNGTELTCSCTYFTSDAYP